MPLIVEDGTGLSTAQSYVSVAYADTYFSIRNITAWTGTDEVKAAALICATEYVDLRWGYTLNGSLEFRDTQKLMFPRINLSDRNNRLLSGVPDLLKRATAEYAIISLSQLLMPNPQVDTTGRIVISESEGMGPMTESKTYQAGFIGTRSYPKADALMSIFVSGGGGNGTVYV